MQDYILAGLVFLLFVVFLFKTQSFADVMSPAPAPAPGNCFSNSRGVVQFIDDPSGNNNALCQKQATGYPTAKPGESGKHYCCK